MASQSWVKEFHGAITVCDLKGVILEMNEEAARTFNDQGGEKLVGTNVLDCHPEPARTKLRHLIETQQVNVYTIEKDSTRKLVYQAPWYQDGKCQGIVELSLEIPAQIPHFVRETRDASPT